MWNVAHFLSLLMALNGFGYIAVTLSLFFSECALQGRSCCTCVRLHTFCCIHSGVNMWRKDVYTQTSTYVVNLVIIESRIGTGSMRGQSKRSWSSNCEYVGLVNVRLNKSVFTPLWLTTRLRVKFPNAAVASWSGTTSECLCTML